MTNDEITSLIQTRLRLLCVDRLQRIPHRAGELGAADLTKEYRDALARYNRAAERCPTDVVAAIETHLTEDS